MSFRTDIEKLRLDLTNRKPIPIYVNGGYVARTWHPEWENWAWEEIYRAEHWLDYAEQTRQEG